MGTLIDLINYKASDQAIINRIKSNPEEIDEKDQNGETPLMVAAYKDRPTIVEYLLEYGADLTITDNGWCGLHWAALYSTTALSVMMTYVCTHPDKLDLLDQQTDEQAWTALHYAAYHTVGHET